MGALHAERTSLLNEWYDRMAAARPFIRWVGGKQTFLASLGDVFPTPIHGRYFEPFVGGASVFFFIQRRSMHPLDAVLGDVNVPLIRMYSAVKADPETVYAELAELQRDYLAATARSAFYYKLRDKYNSMLPNPSASLFIFINRACWNGLYRVNGKGRFNVPYGRPKTDTMIPAREDLLNAASALTRARLRATSWDNSIAGAKAGDFIFLDPPYFSDVKRDDTKYRARAFDLHEHERLASRLADLASRGVDFVLTNSAETEMVDLYRTFGLSVHVVRMRRTISGKTDQRLPVDELIVTPRSATTSAFVSPQRAAAFQALQTVG